MIRIILRCMIVAAAVLISGCNKNRSEYNGNGELDFSRMQEVSISRITTGSDEQAVSAQANTKAAPSPMEVGKTFRLYAFPKGVTAMDKLIATRTYTIKDVAGEPVLDINQEKLFLPIGDVDIFLVGPVQYDLNEGKVDNDGNPLPPYMSVVASPTGVTPSMGVDLVSSKTTLTVKIGANQFQAASLEHRMAQMEVVVKRPSDATYTDLNVTGVSIMNQNVDGTFVFNDAGGEITPSDEGVITLSPVVREISKDEFRATMYVFPRNKVQLRIGVFMTFKTPGGGITLDRRMESGIMYEPLVAGQMNRFTTKPYLSDQLIFRLRLMPWNDVSKDDMDILASDKVIFSYSAMDAPVTIDGKQFILDRSGNENHAEIVGDIRYNAVDHYYYAASQGAYIKVPSLGKVPIYNLEITASSDRNAKVLAASFSGDGAEKIGVYLPKDNNDLVFNLNNGTESLPNANFPNDIAWTNNLAVYSFSGNDIGVVTIKRNGVLCASANSSVNDGLMTDNKLLWWKSAEGHPELFKLYAARLIAKIDAEAIANNYRNDIMTFSGINVEKDPSKNNYVDEGLILDLRGETGYDFSSLVIGKTVWPDASKAQNHAVLMSSSLPTHANKCYTFDGTQYFKLLRTLGSLQNCTVEIVAKASPQTTILNFTSDSKGDHREFQVHLDWNKEMNCSSPYITTLGREYIRLMKPMDDMVYNYSYQLSNPNQWSFKRENIGGQTTLEARLNGYLESSKTANEIPLLELRHCFIGSNGLSDPQFFKSSIYAIRVYNRPLSLIERQHNYQIDKIKYSIAQ